MPLLLLIAACWSLTAQAPAFRTVRWTDLPPGSRPLLAAAGLSAELLPAWLQQHQAGTQRRLDRGAAEHVAYFLLQSRRLTADPPIVPAAAARKFLAALTPADRARFRRGEFVSQSFPAPILARIRQFSAQPPVDPRHRLLQSMAASAGNQWTVEQMVQHAFQFLTARNAADNPDTIYRQRGLSADPYIPSMKAVATALNRLPPPTAVLLVGPGLELAARGGFNDDAPLHSPQADALPRLLPNKPATYHCVDIRPEIVAALENGPCLPIAADIVASRPETIRYSLIVATNILVYYDDAELLLAILNLAAALEPGGCLVHNDSRFATRLFAETAGLSTRHYQSIELATPGQLDRVVIHCAVIN